MSQEETQENEAGESAGLIEIDVDTVQKVNAEEIFEIGLGERECLDKKLRMHCQVSVAVQLRCQGYNYQTIGIEMGVAQSWAWRLVQRGMETAQKQLVESVETLREVQKARCDAIITANWENMERGDSFATQNVLKAMAALDAYWGLEPPKRVEHTFTEDARNEAIDQLAKNIAALTPTGDDQGSPTDTPDRVN